MKKAALLLCVTAGFSMQAQAQGMAADFLDKLSAEERPLEDRMRDAARRPYQVMQLLGVEEGMTVVDVSAGAGWYTRVLSAAVGPSGMVISQVGPRGRDSARALAEQLGNTEAFFGNLEDMDENIADAAVTALSIHHGGQDLLAGMYAVLKPGGRAVVIDHEGSPGNDNEALHRMEAAVARQTLEEIGFEIVEESDLLHTNADDHSLNIRAPELARNTDRFLFVVRKPG